VLGIFRHQNPHRLGQPLPSDELARGHAVEGSSGRAAMRQLLDNSAGDGVEVIE